MPGVMFDSVEPTALPASGFDATAGYVNGKYQSSAGLMSRFPYLPHLTISVFASGNARCLDVEPGDATVDEAPGWHDRQISLGQRLPIIYTGASQAAALRAAMGSRTYLLWSAHWTYKSHICGPGTCGYPQADATQWSDPQSGNGLGNVDQTLMSDRFFSAIGGPPVATTLSTDDIAAIVAAVTPAVVKGVLDERINRQGTWTGSTTIRDVIAYSDSNADNAHKALLSAVGGVPVAAANELAKRITPPAVTA